MQALALLIDGENVSARHFPELDQRITELGDPIVKCVFGDFSENRLSEWVGTARDHGFELIFQVSGGKGKNSADIAITIRAMELLHAGRIDGFCLVSSDRDFVPLTMKLRQSGKKVYGFGEAKADETLRRNVTQFFTVGASVRKVRAAIKAKTCATQVGDPLDPKIIDLLRKLGDADPVGSIHLSVLATAIRRDMPDLAAKICGKGKFLKNLKQTGQIEQIGKGSSVRVRLRRDETTAAT